MTGKLFFLILIHVACLNASPIDNSENVRFYEIEPDVTLPNGFIQLGDMIVEVI
jgi:hypothetical protein